MFPNKVDTDNGLPYCGKLLCVFIQCERDALLVKSHGQREAADAGTCKDISVMSYLDVEEGSYQRWRHGILHLKSQPWSLASMLWLVVIITRQ